MNLVENWSFLFILLVIAFLTMRAMDIFIQRFLGVDRTEREQVLQHQIDQLSRKVDDYEKEIDSLRKQVKLLVQQHEEVVVKYNKLEEVYNASKEDSLSLREQVNSFSSNYVNKTPSKVLIVCTGSDEPGFGLDIASIRAVRTETGMEIQQVNDASPENLKKYIDRARVKQDHIYVHLSVRSDREGYQLGSEIVDASWLSTILNGVIVLVIAGTDSDSVADFLGVVPYVISMSGPISHRDASIFSRLFWLEIGNGIGPSLSLKRALQKSPGTIREKIVSHWEM
jgi:hypothetical protein